MNLNNRDFKWWIVEPIDVNLMILEINRDGITEKMNFLKGNRNVQTIRV